MSLSLSHWYPGSGVVLDCIDSDLCTLTYFGYNLDIMRQSACLALNPITVYSYDGEERAGCFALFVLLVSHNV